MAATAKVKVVADSAEKVNMQVGDSLTNLMSGLGTDKDKTIYSSYTFTPMSDGQLTNAYRGDWIARKVIDIPAFDATRKWRSWQADNDQIEKLEETERKFGVRRKVAAAMRWGRLYGGAALIMGYGDADPMKPIDEEKPTAKDGLKYLHVVTRLALKAGDIEKDIASDNFGKPQYYLVADKDGNDLKIHYSRIVRFDGSALPDEGAQVGAPNKGWGDSVLYAVDEAIKQASYSSANIAGLIQEAKIDVIKVPGLMDQVQDPVYREKVLERYRLANVGKSTLNSLLIDGAEEWQRITVNFSGLPDLLKLYLLIASGACDIPATRMLGQAPQGMNATGDSDIRNYYDRIQSDQEDKLQPAMSILDETLIWHTFGARDEKIYYEWNPLWQMDDVQKADVQLKKSQAHQVDVSAGLISPEALRVGRQNQLMEDGVYPGFEAALEDLDAIEVDPNADDPQELDPNDPNVQAAFAAAGGNPAGGGARPKGPQNVPGKPKPGFRGQSTPGSNVIALKRVDSFDAEGDEADFNFVTSDGMFTGYAVRWGLEYHDGMRVQKGAFAQAIEKSGGKFRLLNQHDTRAPIGMLVASEDAIGLRIEGQLNMTLELAKEIKDNIEKNILNGLSIGFVTSAVAKDDPKLYTRIDLEEVSVVTFPSMEEASIDELTIGDMMKLTDDELRLAISQAATTVRGA